MGILSSGLFCPQTFKKQYGNEKFWTFLPKNVRNCDRTSHTWKMVARTHIARTFQKAFRTHIAHVQVCAHVCVCKFNFATHSLIFWLDSKSIYGKVSISQNIHWTIGFLICSGFAILKVLPYLLTQPEYIYLYGGKAFFLAQDTVGLWSQGIP